LAYTANGKVRIELREDLVETADRKGPRLLSLFVLFDPESGAFDWRATDAANDGSAPSYRMKVFNKGQAAYLKDGEFYDFRSDVGPLRLVIRRYHGHASNLRDAEEQSLKDMGETVDPKTAELTQKDIREVSLLALGWDFVLQPGASVGGMIPAVRNVEWNQNSGHWIVTLQGRWTEDVVLDRDYNILALKRTQ
jgi:hypothetical protein